MGTVSGYYNFGAIVCEDDLDITYDIEWTEYVTNLVESKYSEYLEVIVTGDITYEIDSLVIAVKNSIQIVGDLGSSHITSPWPVKSEEFISLTRVCMELNIDEVFDWGVAVNYM